MNPRLRILFCDHLSLARGKYLPADQAATGEARFCQGIYALTYDKDLIPAPGAKMLEGLPDMVARFDLDQARPGWRDGESVVVCDQFDSDGKSLGVCGRAALKRAADDWQARGYTPKIGIELEAYAMTRGGDGRWRPLDTPGAFVYGTGRFTDPHGFTDAIWQRSEQCGFKLEMLTSEFDAPQFEFTLRYDDAVAAIDEVFLFRLMAREIALEHGILLTFMPKPIAALSGSGVHVNFSLSDANGNAIADSTSGDGLSELARGCVAGLLHHHRSLAALLAPTVNSYRRLQPATLSGYWRNWARDHRGVTVRIAGETGAHARIEHRMADAAANPYTAAAAVLQAARLGAAAPDDYPLPPAETADCLENHDAADGVPDSLGAALDELENDRDLSAALGAELVANHIAIKRDEVEKTADLTDDDLRDFYLHFI
ncbi:MAG: glutamine synthetase family protein [Gammaproteobacteria bacterium]|nr:glutamine synthetase family protein [Gammaproteobacteria bacterium]